VANVLFANYIILFSATSPQSEGTLQGPGKEEDYQGIVK